MLSTPRSAIAVALLAGTALGASAAHAGDAAPAPAVKFYGLVEGGFTGNTNDPASGINFGHLFTDKSNDVVLNQVSLTAEKPIDSASSDFNFGFELQGMYGADARYTHFTGEFDRAIKTDRNQLDIVEANVQAHVPGIGVGGMDVKLGQYATPLGNEVISPDGNFFYSHSYLFNFGLPLKHTGLLTTTHVNGTFDVILGVDSGVNTSLGKGDTNGAPAFLGGVGLNGLNDGKTTVLLTTHIGPENPRGTPKANTGLRQYWDLIVTTKATDALTFVTEANYIYDQEYHAKGYGADQYVTYALTPTFSVGGRAEIWRDDQGFFVAQFSGPLDFVNLERGFPNGAMGFGPATYGALTLGVNYKPAVAIGPIDAVIVRPELRYDHAFAGRPFDGGTDNDQFTAALDLIIHF